MSAQYEDWEGDDDRFTLYDYGDRGSYEDFDCVFGDKCCMPYPHFVDECYTAEMAEAYYAEMEGL